MRFPDILTHVFNETPFRLDATVKLEWQEINNRFVVVIVIRPDEASTTIA